LGTLISCFKKTSFLKCINAVSMSRLIMTLNQSSSSHSLSSHCFFGKSDHAITKMLTVTIPFWHEILIHRDCSVLVDMILPPPFFFSFLFFASELSFNYNVTPPLAWFPLLFVSNFILLFQCSLIEMLLCQYPHLKSAFHFTHLH